jgi:hypothetical protein
MDDPFDFVRTVFGPDRLQVAPPELVAPLRIPDRSKQYLLTVGLPRVADFFGGTILRFNLLHRLPTLRQLLPEHAARIDPGWDDCRFLGLDEDDGTGYVLNEADGGSVWSVALDSTVSDFVNSSVEQFGWFVAAYTRFRTIPRAGRADAPGALDKMEQEMRTMDSRAVGEDTVFWPAILLDACFFSN